MSERIAQKARKLADRLVRSRNVELIYKDSFRHGAPSNVTAIVPGYKLGIIEQKRPQRIVLPEDRFYQSYYARHPEARKEPLDLLSPGPAPEQVLAAKWRAACGDRVTNARLRRAYNLLQASGEAEWQAVSQGGGGARSPLDTVQLQEEELLYQAMRTLHPDAQPAPRVPDPDAAAQAASADGARHVVHILPRPSAASARAAGGRPGAAWATLRRSSSAGGGAGGSAAAADSRSQAAGQPGGASAAQQAGSRPAPKWQTSLRNRGVEGKASGQQGEPDVRFASIVREMTRNLGSGAAPS